LKNQVFQTRAFCWLETRALQKNGSTKLNRSGLEKGRSVIAQTIRGLSVCANLGLLKPEQYFDFCLTIVEAANDPGLREVFRRTILNWLQLKFSEVAEAKARKAYPKIMSWFHSETNAQARRKDEEGDLEAFLPRLNAQCGQLSSA